MHKSRDGDCVTRSSQLENNTSIQVWLQGPRRPFDPDDSNEAGLRLPLHEDVAVKLWALVAMLTLAAYIVLRIYDLSTTFQVRPPCTHAQAPA